MHYYRAICELTSGGREEGRRADELQSTVPQATVFPKESDGEVVGPEYRLDTLEYQIGLRFERVSPDAVKENGGDVEGERDQRDD